MSYRVLLLGVGRSSGVLVDFLATQIQKQNWHVSLADMQPALLSNVSSQYSYIFHTHSLDISHQEHLYQLIARHDLVISLLPPDLHLQVAGFCLEAKSHLITASYCTPQMLTLDKQAKNKNLTFLTETGLDPGIDHISGLYLLDRLRKEGAQIKGFYSYGGGLIAPQSDDNPWHYKFTWNPRNVVLAGQAGARFLRAGQEIFIPYEKIFEEIHSTFIQGIGELEVYANRDSLFYQNIYGLQNAENLLRGTLRHKGYCPGWQAIIRLGLTREDITLPTEGMSCKKLMGTLLPSHSKNFNELIAYLKLGSPTIIRQLEWLDLLNTDPLDYPYPQATPAQLLQHWLEKKWTLAPDDHDMVAMQHKIIFTHEAKTQMLTSQMFVTGEDHVRTAMAKTVGLPLGLAARLISEGKITRRGVILPVTEDVYLPLLKALENYQITFQESLLELPEPIS